MKERTSFKDWWQTHRLTVKFVLFSFAAVAVVAFIFSNSLMNRGESSEMSQNIAESLKPILDPADNMEDDQFHGLVRKLAHLTEFAMLGFCCGGAMFCVAEWRKRYYAADVMLITLFIAVIDELIQRSNDRASDVRDVLIDFSGAVIGLTLISAIEILLRKIKNNRSKPMS